MATLDAQEAKVSNATSLRMLLDVLGCFHFASYTVFCFWLGKMKVADYFPLTEGDRFVFHVSLADVKVSKVNSC